MILSIHGEFCVGDPLTSRLVSVIIYDDWLIAGKTIHQLMAAWLWSWKAMLSGVYPAVNHQGNEVEAGSYRARLANTPIAAGWKFVFSGAYYRLW